MEPPPRRIRAVLDANVVVSAAIRPQGPPGRIIQRRTEGAFELVVSSAVTSEIRRALGYEKVARLTDESPEEIELWLTALEVLAIRVEPTRRVSVVEDDPADDIYLEAALEGLASVVVSGDSHLLRLGRHEGIDILRPRAFLELLGPGRR